jgi:Ca2+-binding RTX toxin-like protein
VLGEANGIIHWDQPWTWSFLDGYTFNPAEHVHVVDGGSTAAPSLVVLQGSSTDYRFTTKMTDLGLEANLKWVDSDRNEHLIGQLYRTNPLLFLPTTTSSSAAGADITSAAEPQFMVNLDGSAVTVQTALAGQATLTVDPSFDYTDAGDEDFTVTGSGLGDIIALGSGNNTVIETTGSNIIFVKNALTAGSNTIHGGDGYDTIVGGRGNDTMTGGAGDDAFYGGTGTNLVSGGAGFDRIHVSQGADTVRDILADLDGDTIVAFDADDMMDIQGTLAGRGNLGVTPGSGGAGTATLAIGGSSFQMEGDFSSGEFMMVARGSGPNAHTMLTFENLLPSLSEGATVDPTLVNGIANEPFLTGDGAVGFKVELKSAMSAYANTLGAYKIAADGTISDVHILFDNTMKVGSGATVDLGMPANGERVAFFLIQNGFDRLGSLPDNLSFVTPGTGTPSDTDSGIPPLLQSSTLGAISATIFHSLSALNPAEEMHVLSGTSAGGRELLIGFEDLPSATGDNDFQDVVIGIRVTTDDFFLL